jgi:hypothetical protein
MPITYDQALHKMERALENMSRDQADDAFTVFSESITDKERRAIFIAALESIDFCVTEHGVIVDRTDRPREVRGEGSATPGDNSRFRGRRMRR